MRAVFLGTGNAFTTEERSHTSILLPDINLLLEAPPDILSKLNRIGYRPEDLEYVFVSHLHGDHFLGLPFLLLYSHHVERVEATYLGPEDLESKTHKVTDLSYPGLAEDAFDPDAFRSVHGGEMSLGSLALAFLETQHSVPNFSVSLEARGRKVTYSGDTSSDISELARGADLLIHEAGLPEREEGVHSSPTSAIETFERSGAQRLALVHLFDDIENPAEDTARILVPRDGEEIEI